MHTTGGTAFHTRGGTAFHTRGGTAFHTRSGTAFHTSFIKSSALDQQQLEAEVLFPHCIKQNGLQWLQPIGHYVLNAILIPVGQACIPFIAVVVFLYVLLKLSL